MKPTSQLFARTPRSVASKPKKLDPWFVIRQRKEQQQRWRPPGSPFPIGQKNVYLPKFTIALCRTPHLPARLAQFEVPLWFNKLDLRDYLYHAYGLRALSVRSVIRQRALQRVDPALQLPGKRHWYRPQSDKFMTVELERPFVWPAEPTKQELDEHWDHDLFLLKEKRFKSIMREDGTGQLKARADTDKANKEQARKLLSGEVKWIPGAAPGTPLGPLGLASAALDGVRNAQDARVAKR